MNDSNLGSHNGNGELQPNLDNPILAQIGLNNNDEVNILTPRGTLDEGWKITKTGVYDHIGEGPAVHFAQVEKKARGEAFSELIDLHKLVAANTPDENGRLKPTEREIWQHRTAHSLIGKIAEHHPDLMATVLGKHETTSLEIPDGFKVGSSQRILTLVLAGGEIFSILQVEPESGSPEVVLARYGHGTEGEKFAQPIAKLDNGEEVKVGRDHQPELVKSRWTSANHFKVSLKEGRIIITDLGSTHKTLVIGPEKAEAGKMSVEDLFSQNILQRGGPHIDGDPLTYPSTREFYIDTTKPK